MSRIMEDKERLAEMQDGKQIELPLNPGDDEEYINILTDFMNQCSEQCRFIEAESARIKIDELKSNSNKGKKVDLTSRHQQEQVEINQAHDQQMDEFNTFWDEKINEFQTKADELVQDMIEKHKQEIEVYKKELEQGLPIKSKDSNRLLSLKSKREVLSKQRKFMDAQVTHLQVEQKEIEEQEQFDQDRNSKVNTQVKHLQNKQFQELQALQMKIQKQLSEQQKTRIEEQTKLQLKYRVVTKDIKNRQQNESIYLNKTFANPGMNGSKYLTQSRMSVSRIRH